MQAIHGVGIDWTFAGEAVEYGGFLVRGTAVLVSLGGMLVTALMLGLVSGESAQHLGQVSAATPCQVLKSECKEASGTPLAATRCSTK